MIYYERIGGVGSGMGGLGGLGGLGVGVRTCLIFKKCPNKCPFWPLRVEVLKRETRNIKKHGCDHYALISYFRHQKCVTVLFGRRRWVVGVRCSYPIFVFS